MFLFLIGVEVLTFPATLNAGYNLGRGISEARNLGSVKLISAGRIPLVVGAVS